MYSPFHHPDKVIARGSVILTALYALTMASSYATVDAAVRSGEIHSYVIEPSKKAYTSFVAELEKSLAEDRAAEAQRAQNAKQTYTITNDATVVTEVNSTGSAEVKIEKKVQLKPNGQVIIQQNTTPPSTAAPSSYSNEWYEQEKARMAAEQQKWIEESKARMDQKYQDSLKAQETWSQQKEAEAQAGLDEFRKQAEAEQEAFKEANGF